MLEILRQAGLAFVATLGFAILFNVRQRSLLACGITGLMGYLARSLALGLGLTPPVATLAGAALVALLSEIFAYRFRLPATVFIVTGFIPLVPGVAAARAMIELISGDYARGWPDAMSAGLTAGAIAAGIGGLGAAARALRLRRASLARQ
jgi:uncharacterized membrane protein YjjB (DUF3815 family)